MSLQKQPKSSVELGQRRNQRENHRTYHRARDTDQQLKKEQSVQSIMKNLNLRLKLTTPNH